MLRYGQAFSPLAAPEGELCGGSLEHLSCGRQPFSELLPPYLRARARSWTSLTLCDTLRHTGVARETVGTFSTAVTQEARPFWGGRR
jgi:hypothetical protein